MNLRSSAATTLNGNFIDDKQIDGAAKA